MANKRIYDLNEKLAIDITDQWEVEIDKSGQIESSKIKVSELSDLISVDSTRINDLSDTTFIDTDLIANKIVVQSNTSLDTDSIIDFNNGLGNAKVSILHNGDTGIGTETPDSRLTIKASTTGTGGKAFNILDSLASEKFSVTDEGVLDIEGDIHLGNSSYPAKSNIYFAQNGFFNMGTNHSSAGRDFRFYSSNSGGGGNYGFQFYFNNAGAFTIRPSDNNILLSTLNKDNAILFETTYDSSGSTLTENPVSFRPNHIGYFPSANDKVLEVRNWNDDYADNAVIGTKAYFTRQGLLAFNTDKLSMLGTKAVITMKGGQYDGLYIDGVSPIQVVTASDTAHIQQKFEGTPNYHVPIQLFVGTQITANGETRTIVNKSKTGVTLDVAVNWHNALLGYDFTYKNPYLHFEDESSNPVVIVDPDGNLGVNKVPTEKIDVSGNIKTDSLIKMSGLTTAEITALTAVAGDIAYDTTLNKHQGFDGTTWNNLY